MQVNDDYIDELFARKLGNMEATPPENGWARIENELESRSRNTRRFWLAAASVALILSVTASVIYLQTKNKTLQEELALTIQKKPLIQHDGQPDQQSLMIDRERNIDSQGQKQISGQRQNKHAQDGEILQHSTNKATNQDNLPASQDDGITSALPTVPALSTNTSESSASNKIADNRLSVEKTPSNIPVYVDSWDEMRRLQPLKTSRLELLSKKESQPVPPAMMAMKESTPVVPAMPVYDEIAFVDVTAVTAVAAKPRPYNRWEITGQFAPVYSYRAITGVPSGMNKSDFDQAESGLLAYSGGITVAYRVRGRLSVRTGVFYLQMGQSINSVTPVSNMYAAVSSNNSYAKNFVRTSSGNVTVASNMKADVNTTYASYFNSEPQPTAKSTNTVSTANVAKPVKYKLIERVDYLEIPLLLRYKVIDRKLNFYLLGGMSTNILIGNNIFIDNGSDVTKEGNLLMARPVNYSSTVGLGLSYQIGNNLLVDIEPSFKYYLQPYTTNNQIGSNPYAFGVFTGVIYRF